MSAVDKLKNKGQRLRGQLKKQAGKETGDPGLEAEGRADQTSGNLKDAGEKVKDAFESS